MMKDKTKEISSEKTTNKYERRLIRKIKLFGSSKDADTLVRMYYDEIYYFVVRQINDRDSAYDLTQEIFISMLPRKARFLSDMALSYSGEQGHRLPKAIYPMDCFS